MPYRVILTPAAKADILDALDWYSEHAPAVIPRVRAAQRGIFRRIATNPQQFPAGTENTRKALLRQFPYVVVLESAAERAVCRIDEALAPMRTLENHPYRGTEHPELRSEIRTVTSKKFIFYFEIDGPLSEVRILAVFFGGVDHRRQILDRLHP